MVAKASQEKRDFRDTNVAFILLLLLRELKIGSVLLVVR